MLNELDLNLSLDKENFRTQSDALERELGTLSRDIKALGIPVMIVFEGWEASGKGTQINELIHTLDPRQFNVYTAATGDEDERLRPHWWRYWTRTPARGRLAVFDQSWYRQALEQGVDAPEDAAGFEAACRDINAFERQLRDGGTLILKFFLHISKKEQKKRFEALEENKAMRWKVSKQDWKQNKYYDDWLKVTQTVLERTDTESAPWTLVEAEDRRFATLKIFSAVAAAFRDATLRARSIPPSPAVPLPAAVQSIPGSSLLDTADLSLALSPEDYKAELRTCQSRIRELEYALYQKRRSLMVLYEGWDAAGKGGNIRRLTENMDPRGYDVVPVAAPTETERSHHYLWRFWNAVPKGGHITILDRTWYGRVLVERVEGFCSPEDWKRAYREINEMEAHLTGSGVGLVKFWLHISPEEQLRRFEERQATPWKNWKITDEDWRNREKWDAYRLAVDEMLTRTSTQQAPWTVVESENKYYARIKALKTVIAAMERLLEEG